MKTSSVALLQTFVAVARRGSFGGAARELGVTTSAVSQSVKQLEAHLGVVLLARTTRSVSLTDAGRRLLERAGPALGEAVAALTEVSAQPGEVVGRVRLTVPRAAVPYVVTPVLPVFRARHPRVDVEVVVEDRLVDIVAEGFDAGVRLTEAIERDMVQVRLTEAFRFVVVGAPSYLEKRGAPQRPEDLLEHECIGLRLSSTGALYAWEFERGRRTWRVPVRGGLIASDGALRLTLARRGMGLAYVDEPSVAEAIRAGSLRCVLDAYAAHVPGFFLYYPSRAQRSPALRLFVETARELASTRISPSGSSPSVGG
jgi:DNA-binding transcriptional LysR family regulator